MDITKEKEFELHKFIAKASREDAFFLAKYIDYGNLNTHKESEAMAKAYWYQINITPHQEALQINPNDFNASNAILSHFREGVKDQFLEDAKRTFGQIKKLENTLNECSKQRPKYDLITPIKEQRERNKVNTNHEI